MRIPSSFTGRYLNWGASTDLLNPPIPRTGYGQLFTKAGRALYFVPLALIGPLGGLYHLVQAARCKAITLLTNDARIKSTHDLLSLKYRQVASIDFGGLMEGGVFPLMKLSQLFVFTALTALSIAIATASLFELITGNFAGFVVLCAVMLTPLVTFNYFAWKVLNSEEKSKLLEFTKDPTAFKIHCARETKWYYERLRDKNLVVDTPLTNKEIWHFDRELAEKTYISNSPREYIQRIHILLNMNKIRPENVEIVRHILKEPTRPQPNQAALSNAQDNVIGLGAHFSPNF